MSVGWNSRRACIESSVRGLGQVVISKRTASSSAINFTETTASHPGSHAYPYFIVSPLRAIALVPFVMSVNASGLANRKGLSQPSALLPAPPGPTQSSATTSVRSV